MKNGCTFKMHFGGIWCVFMITNRQFFYDNSGENVLVTYIKVRDGPIPLFSDTRYSDSYVFFSGEGIRGVSSGEVWLVRWGGILPIDFSVGH